MDSDSIGNRGTSDYGWFYAVGRYAERCVFAFAHTAHTAHTARSGTAYPAQRSAGRVGRCWLLAGRLLATGAAVAVRLARLGVLVTLLQVERLVQYRRKRTVHGLGVHWGGCVDWGGYGGWAYCGPVWYM